MSPSLPRILIVDDLFGRELPGVSNRERENLCGKFLLQEETITGRKSKARFEISEPIARAVFSRGQSPVESSIGSIVENDLNKALEVVGRGWFRRPKTGLQKVDGSPWSMVLLDLCFYTGPVTEDSHRRTPGMPEGRPGDEDPRNYFGLTLLDAIHREFPELPIFILSSKPRDEVSLEFSRRGALGFIDRSALDAPELLREALWNHGLFSDPIREVIGQSLPLLLALREARIAARQQKHVLLRGERGTGKGLFASYIHRMSALRASKGPRRPFEIFNSAAFTPNLYEAELFGVKKGAATGVEARDGLIAKANGGELFLDEVADMPQSVRAALLRILEDGQLRRVGADEAKSVTVRFLFATNANVEDEALGFRADFLDRLGYKITLPPLRERPDDIPLLVEAFVRQAEKATPGARRREVTPEALEGLCAYDWPGNIRELQNTLVRAVSRFPDLEHLVPGHLPLSAAKRKGGDVVGPNTSTQIIAAGNVERQIPESLIELLRAATFPPTERAAWTGLLPRLQAEQTRLVARLLLAALEATKRPTPENPSGVLQIHPAAKLLTGNSSLTASKAADLFKRTLGLIAEELEGDLREAYQISLRLRPKTAGRKKVLTPLP